MGLEKIEEPAREQFCPWWRLPVVALALALCVWLIYGRALRYPFVFDDLDTIPNNSSIRQLLPLSRPLNPPMQTSTAGRPLVNLAFALDYQFFGNDPAGYRAVNYVLHTLNALLLFAIVGRTVRLDKRLSQHIGNQATAIAFAAALIWAAHPLVTEAVVYVTQRTELMVALSYLATLYFAVRFFQSRSRIARITWASLATFACAAGMACKEVMVSAPVLAFIYEWIFIERNAPRLLRRSWPLYAGLSLGWIVLFWLNLNAPRSASAGFSIGTPATTWWLTQTKVFVTYLRLIIWPWPLVVHRETPFLTTIAQAWPWVLATFAATTAIGLAAWKRSAAGFAGLLALAILAPTSLVPLFEVAAERRMYLPLGAAVSVVVVGVHWLARRMPRHGVAIVASAVAVAVPLGAISKRRTHDYRTAMSLWADAVAREPENVTAHSYLGVELVSAGRFDEGMAHHRRAVDLNPTHIIALNNLGAGLLATGHPAEAIVPLTRVLAAGPNFAEGQLNFGAVLASLGRRDEAIPHFRRAIELNPQFFEAYENLGRAEASSGRPREAAAAYRAALNLRPQSVKVRVALGRILMDLESPDAALGQFNEALRGDPGNVDALMNSAVAHALADRRREALACAQLALDAARSQGNEAAAARIEEWTKSYR